MQTGWVKDGTRWMYANNNGSIVSNEWRYINGNWYYFNNSGVMLTGTINLNSTIYNLASDGHLIN